MSERRRRTSSRAGKAGYPALRAFCRAYLHQDVLAGTDSVVAAVDSFRADATPAERRALASDWRRFLSDRHGHTIEAIAARLGTLGAAWTPTTMAELETFGAAILAEPGRT